MKTIVAGLFVLCFCAACGGKNTKSETEEPPTDVVVDSLLVEAEAETVWVPEETKIPAAVDGAFDDFIYSYAADEQLQKERTIFPLLYNRDGEQLAITEEEWEHDSLFTTDSYYTLLFDNEEEMELEKKETLTAVTVEWIFFDTNERKRYHFKKVNELWKLASIEQHPISNYPDASFLAFFHTFSTDSLFQSEHVAHPLKFVTTDPDDEFQILETTIDADRWFAFKPVLPTARLSNIDYGQTLSESSRRRIVDLRGVGNGFSNTLTFHRSGADWKLVQFDDLSN